MIRDRARERLGQKGLMLRMRGPHVEVKSFTDPPAALSWGLHQHDSHCQFGHRDSIARPVLTHKRLLTKAMTLALLPGVRSWWQPRTFCQGVEQGQRRCQQQRSGTGSRRTPQRVRADAPNFARRASGEACPGFIEVLRISICQINLAIFQVHMSQNGSSNPACVLQLRLRQP